MLWVYFVLCTVLVQLVFLNLLIAIMGDTYGRVQETIDQDHLKELCKLILENKFLLTEKSAFKKMKYIVVANVKTSQDGFGSSTWEGKLSKLKVHFNNSINEVEQSIKQVRTQNEKYCDQMQNRIIS